MQQKSKDKQNEINTFLLFLHSVERYANEAIKIEKYLCKKGAITLIDGFALVNFEIYNICQIFFDAK